MDTGGIRDPLSFRGGSATCAPHLAAHGRSWLRASRPSLARWRGGRGPVPPARAHNVVRRTLGSYGVLFGKSFQCEVMSAVRICRLCLAGPQLCQARCSVASQTWCGKAHALERRMELLRRLDQLPRRMPRRRHTRVWPRAGTWGKGAVHSVRGLNGLAQRSAMIMRVM